MRKRLSDTYKLAQQECMKNAVRNVFVIMRYGQHPQYSQLEEVIRKTLTRHGLIPILARDTDYVAELWANVKFCMDNSSLAIVVFEDIDRQIKHNPNVALELGYMIALGKRCLILKERGLEALPTDILSHLYHDFDAFSIETTVSSAIERWIRELRLSSYEMIQGAWIEVQLERTQKIIHEYERLLKTDEPCTIRLAGFLSSLAVSGIGSRKLGMTNELMQLYERERDLLLTLIDSGKTVRCIIAPSVYVQRLRDDSRLLEEAETFYLPRYDALINIVNKFLGHEALQIIWSEHLPRQSLIATNARVFVGTRTTHERQTRTTIISDPVLLNHEVEEFENVFEDTVDTFKRQKNLVGCSGENLWYELKLSVIKQTTDARNHLQATIDSLRKNATF